MKALTLTAREAAELQRSGRLVLPNKRGGELRTGDRVYIKEPWYLLRAPEGAYFLDSPPRYILRADATAEPLMFSYEPAETMPRRAVKRYAAVTLTPEGVEITLL